MCWITDSDGVIHKRVGNQLVMRVVPDDVAIAADPTSLAITSNQCQPSSGSQLN